MSQIFVTGASGQVGSALVRCLIQQGHRVHVLLRDGSWHPDLDHLGDALTVFRGSFLNTQDLRRGMCGCEIVFHVAGMISYRPQDAWLMRQVNIYGTALVAQIALELGVQRLVHTSSTAALGYSFQAREVLDESTELAPEFYRVAYLKTKRAAEAEIQRTVAQGLDAVMVNPSTIFGPGDAKANTGKLFAQIKGGLSWAPPGGTAVVSIDKVIQGHLLALEKGATGQRYVLSSLNLPFQQLFGLLAELYGGQGIRKLPKVLERPLIAAAELAQILPMELDLSADVLRFSFNYRYFDSAKAQAELGWQPDTVASFKDTLAQAKDWYTAS